MNELLRQFLSSFPTLSQEDVIGISQNLIVKEFKKDTSLLTVGMIPKKCYYLLDGCIREYRIIDGAERTIEFYTKSNATITTSGYLEQVPSESFLTCTADSVLIEGDPIQDQKMYEKFPVLESLTRLMMEREWGSTKEKLASFITSSPESRYLNLLETRPELLALAPQHQIASFLGITPESLSRIRKRITKG